MARPHLPVGGRNAAAMVAEPYVLVVLGFLAVCIALWFYQERRRRDRAELLIRATRRIAAGEPEVTVGLRGRDEFALLGSAIEQMASQLRLKNSILRDRQEWFRMLLEQGSD